MAQHRHASEDDIAQYLSLFDKPVDAVLAIKEHLETKRSSVKHRIQSPAPGTPVIVSARDLHRGYKVGKTQVDALRGVSVEIHQGEFVALTGPSGSGKSTLLQSIGGLDKPSSGTILVDGTDIAKLSDNKLSTFRNSTIGFVFQFFYLQPFLTVRQNIEVPGMFAGNTRSDRRLSVEQVAASVGLSERLEHMPSELSGGQMQRVAIARALLNQPKIILADEPTGNLDSANSRNIIELFDKIRQEFGTTIAIVTHDRAIANRADREISLLDGKLA